MKISLRVLVVEDSRDDAELLLRALRQAGYEPSHGLVQNAQAMRSMLNRQTWDLVISDYVLPGFGGPAALQIFKEANLDIPFIVVSGKIGEDVAVEALQSGAKDYLLKDRLTRLGPAIERALKEAAQERKRKQAETALRESEERYRRLVESCPEAMFIADETNIVFANPAAVALIGAKSPVEIINKPFLEFVDEAHRGLVAEHLRQSLEGVDGPLLEHRLLRLDGGRVLIETLARVIQYHGDPVVQLLCRDVSGRKQLEQQLLNSIKMDAVGRLAGGVANDFNNLLTVVTGYAGLIRSGLGADHPLQPDLQQVIQSTERAIGLTNQLLAISRKEVVAPESIDLNTIIQQIAPLIGRLMGPGVKTEMVLATPLASVRADRGQIETILINLAVHARDSMQEGSAFTLSTQNLEVTKQTQPHAQLKPGQYVVLTVSDTGTGLTQEFQDHLFEPFFGGSNPGKNTGLGLATVYAIVKQHGGHIACSSEVGKGSKFVMHLPAAPAPARRAPLPMVEARSGAVIMLVEDEEILREFGNLVLRKNGYQVLAARDGIEALSMAEQFNGKLDLLFTDVVMPRMGGAELSRRFSQRYAQTPVLFTSGYPRTILSDSGLQEEGVEFLQKPYSTQALLLKIREVMARKPAAPADK